MFIILDEWGGYESRMDRVLFHQSEMDSQGEVAYGIVCGTLDQPSWIAIDSASYFRIQDRDSVCLYTTHLRGRVRGFLDERHPHYDQRGDAQALTLQPLVEVWGVAVVMLLLCLAIWTIPDFSIRVGLWLFAVVLSAYMWWFSVA